VDVGRVVARERRKGGVIVMVKFGKSRVFRREPWKQKKKSNESRETENAIEKITGALKRKESGEVGKS